MSVTTTGPGTSAGDRTLRASLISLFPIRSVVLPWFVARLVAVPILIATTPGRRFYAGSLLSMDGQWFRLIALDWYDRPYQPGAWSEYPFFPLFPAVGGALMKGGMPSTVALAGLSWLASLLAFAAIHRLAVVHAGPAAARWAVWFVALSPGALSLVLGYADAFYLAAIAWALVFAGDGRWTAAGTAAALATASRPNGWIAVVAVIIVVARTDRSWRAVAAAAAPSAVFLIGWFWYLDHATGDPFVFWSAKSAWEETSIVEWAGRPLTDHLEMFHVAWFAVALAFYIRRVRHQPPEWLAITVMTVVPALLFGVVGLARYAVLAFPMQVAVADSLSRRSSTWVIWAALGFSTASLGYFAHAVVADSWLP
jgi:Gpi18-like mannosyltransferase